MIDFTIQSTEQQLQALIKSTPWNDLVRKLELEIYQALGELAIIDPTDSVSIAKIQEAIRCKRQLKETPDVLLDLLKATEERESQ